MDTMPSVETIEAGDKGFHAVVISQVQAAQAVSQTWSAYLTNKYRLTPHDTVQNDGVIVRGSAD